MLPMETVTDLNNAVSKGVSSRMAQRVRYLSFFQSEIRWELCNGQFLFYTSSTESDDEVRKHIEKEAPLIVLPQQLNLFARHRWCGAQEVFESASLFLGTLNLGEHCLAQWLGNQPPVSHPLREALAQLSGHDDQFAKRRRAAHDAAIVPVEGAHDDAPMPSNPTSAFFQAKRMDLESFSKSQPRGHLLIKLLVNRGLDKGLRRKLFIAGDRWQKARDQQTSTGGGRAYRVVEAAQNTTEKRATQRALELACNAAEWGALPAADKTLANRAYALRKLTRQVGAIVVILKVPHENTPFLLFNVALAGTEDAQLSFPSICECCQCDFTNYWLSAYPGERFNSKESKLLLSAIADRIRTESTSSECGHSYWQAVCRSRSLQCQIDSFEPVSAASFFRQNRRPMLAAEVEAEPKPAGRKKKAPRVQKRRKLANTQRPPKRNSSGRTATAVGVLGGFSAKRASEKG